MSVILGFYYPDESTWMGPGGVKWEPHLSAAAGSKIEEDDGIYAEVAGDGVSLWSNQFGPASEVINYKFDQLTEADRASFKAFRAIVRGASFRIFDPISMSYITAIGFAPNGFSRDWDIPLTFDERLSTLIRVLVAL